MKAAQVETSCNKLTTDSFKAVLAAFENRKQDEEELSNKSRANQNYTKNYTVYTIMLLFFDFSYVTNTQTRRVLKVFKLEMFC